MKKIVKIVAIMAVLSTVFVGCKKPTDDPADSQPKAPATETPATPGTPETPADPAAKTTFWSENEGTLGGGYWAEAKAIIDEDGYKVLKIFAGDYATFTYTLKTPIDISGKKIVVTAKYVPCDVDGYETYSAGTNTFKVCFETDETHGNETAYNADNADYIKELTTEYVDYKIAGSWKEYQFDNEADLTNINIIKIAPQTHKGLVYIKDIKFVD